jgi:uncharacterized protein
MTIIKEFFQIVFLILIKVYQFTLSPLLGPACRFYPSCSEYAYKAILRHGPINGSILAVKRILRCHPFHPGGVDPVP